MDVLPAAEAALSVLLVLAAAVWVGGYLAIAVVARVATRTLESAARVSFFRGLGRAYLLVGGPALIVALASGAVLLAGRPWDGGLTAVAALAAGLVLTTVTGIIQARHMTRLRRRALHQPDAELLTRIHHGARRAGLLRALIGVLSLALLILGVLLAT